MNSRMTMSDYARLGESLGGAYATYREKGLRNRAPEEVQQYTPEQLAAYEQNYAQTGDAGEMSPTGLQYGAQDRRQTVAPQTQYRLGGLTQAKPFSPEEARMQNEADIREQWKSQGSYGEDRARNYDETQLRGLQTEALKNELGIKKEEQAVLKAAKSPEAFLKFLNDQYPDDNDYVMHKDASGITHFIQDNGDGKPVSAAKFKDWEDDGISQVLQYAPKLAADSWKMRQEQRNRLAQIEAQKQGELAVAKAKAGLARGGRGAKVDQVTEDGRPVVMTVNGPAVYDENNDLTPYTGKVLKVGTSARDVTPPSYEKWAELQDDPTPEKYAAFHTRYVNAMSPKLAAPAGDPRVEAQALVAAGRISLEDANKRLVAAGLAPIGGPAPGLRTPTPEQLRKNEFDRMLIQGTAAKQPMLSGLR